MLDLHAFYLQVLNNFRTYETKIVQSEANKEPEIEIESSNAGSYLGEVKVESDVFAEPLPSESPMQVEALMEEDEQDEIEIKHEKKQLPQYSVQFGDTLIIGKRLNQKYSSGKFKYQYDCNQCSKTFTSKTAIIYHLKTHVYATNPVQSLYQCDLCQKSFRERSILVAHMRGIHLRENAKKEACPMCGYQTTKLQIHIDRVHVKRELQCKFCNEKFNYLAALHLHMYKKCSARDLKPFCCHLCGQKIKLKTEIQEHLDAHEGILKYKCEEEGCAKIFEHKRLLTSHVNSVHRKYRKKTEGGDGSGTAQSNSNELTEVCTICSKRFNNKWALKSHMHRHDPNKTRKKREIDIVKPFVCDVCSKTFAHLSTLRSHIKTIHLNSDHRQQMCEICGKAVGPARSQLEIHNRIYHSNRTREKCPVCHKFVLNVRDHYKFNHVSTGEIHCPICNKKVINSSRLNHHMRNMHPTESQRHHCSACNKSYKHKYQLNEHYHATHLGSDVGYLYRCEWCSFEVNYKRNLLAHYRKNHMEYYGERIKQRHEKFYGTVKGN